MLNVPAVLQEVRRVVTESASFVLAVRGGSAVSGELTSKLGSNPGRRTVETDEFLDNCDARVEKRADTLKAAVAYLVELSAQPESQTRQIRSLRPSSR